MYCVSRRLSTPAPQVLCGLVQSTLRICVQRIAGCWPLWYQPTRFNSGPPVYCCSRYCVIAVPSRSSRNTPSEECCVYWTLRSIPSVETPPEFCLFCCLFFLVVLLFGVQLGKVWIDGVSFPSLFNTFWFLKVTGSPLLAGAGMALIAVLRRTR